MSLKQAWPRDPVTKTKVKQPHPKTCSFIKYYRCNIKIYAGHVHVLNPSTSTVQAEVGIIRLVSIVSLKKKA